MMWFLRADDGEENAWIILGSSNVARKNGTSRSSHIVNEFEVKAMEWSKQTTSGIELVL